MKRIIATLLASPLEGALERAKRLFPFVVSMAVFFFISTATTFAHINTLIPSSTPAGSPDFTLTIQGFDILPEERFLWNGSPLTTTWDNSTQVRAMIPARLVVSAGTATVTLEGSNSLIFTITPPTSCRYFIGIGNGRLIGQTFSADGGTSTMNITTDPTCAWAAVITSGDSFVSLTSAHSVGGSELLSPLIATGSGPGSVGYSVGRNSRADLRSAVIRLYRRDFAATLDAEPFTVNQEGTRCPASAYIISPLDEVRDTNPGSGSIQVTAPRDCSWTASSEQRWIDVRYSVGTGGATLPYDVRSNEGPPRSGIITVAGREFSVFQIPSDCFVRTLCAYFPSACQELGDGILAASRRFRDEVLAKTPRGQRYTKLYYQFSTEAVGILMFNPILIMRSQEVLQRYKPVLDSIIRGEQVSLTLGDIAEIESFLGRFETKGSLELREAINGLTEDLRDPQLHAEFNITVTDGPRRELPAQGTVGRIKQTGMMMAPLGLLLFCFPALRPRRKNAEAALKRLIPLTIVLGLVSGQWTQISGQIKSSGQSSVASGQLKNNREMPSFTFEANQGQTDPQVKFISRRNGYNLFLTQTEAIMALKTQVGNRPQAITDALRMKLIGANPLARIEGLDKTLAVSNYFAGRDSATWRTNVPSYTKIRYGQIYPGVDMVYYGNRRNLEYDFIVAPGANPAQIRVTFEGAEKIELDAEGDVVLHTPAGEVRQRKPAAYQEVNGARQQIPSRYVLVRNPQSAVRDPLVGFEVGPYDASRPLVIDPVMAYSTYFGGGGNEEGNSIAVDSAGSVYITGFTDSINFPLANASQPTLGGGQQDAFVVKLDPSGTRVVYSTYLGGNGQDNATSIAIDAAGNAYITGFTDSTNFPVRNALQSAKRGDFSAFVVKLGPTGTILNSTLFGGSTSDYGSSIAVDPAGNIYAAGIATSSDLPMANAIQSTHGGLVDMFAAKIDPSGSRLIYSTYLGGIGIEGASSIAVDPAGNLYLTGLTSSPNFRTVNALQSAHGGGLFDAFVTKLNPSGTQIIYSTYLGGGGEDRAFRIAVDSSGSAYVTGDTDSTNFPLANAAQPLKGGSADAFVAKLNPSGNQLVYSTYLGGSGIDGGTAIALDSSGSAYVTGFTASTNFPTANPIQQVFGGAYDGFISKLSSSGSALEYSTYLGGSGIDSGFGIAVDASRNAYVMGVTDSANFSVANAFQATYGGGTADLFIAKIRSGPTITNAMVDGKSLLVFGSGFDSGAKILVDGQAQKSANDDQNSAGALIGKKAGKKIKRGETATLQVRNSDGTLSNEFRFTRP